MITDNTLDLFTTDYDFNFGVKISGSGGGGYVLGFTDDVEKANELLSLPCHFEAFDGTDTLPRSSVGMTCRQKAKKSMRGEFDVIWL